MPISPDSSDNSRENIEVLPLAPAGSDFCTVCGREATDKYEGEYYCDTHLQQRIAMDQ